MAAETTVKRLDIGAHGIRLVAANPAFAPIDVDEDGVAIHGVVVAVMRRLTPTATARTVRRTTRTVGRARASMSEEARK